jgi:hypothetical protein
MEVILNAERLHPCQRASNVEAIGEVSR